MSAVPPAPISIEQFLTAIRAATGTDVDPALRQGIERWLGYYRSLQRVRGGYVPSVRALMRAHFYTFAHAVLDGFSVTVSAFFGLPWSRAAVTHARLTYAFADICREKQLHGPIADVHTYMRDLSVRVVAHRLDRATANPDDHLREVLTCLDQYIAAMLQFCALNIQHSIVQPHLRSFRAGSSR